MKKTIFTLTVIFCFKFIYAQISIERQVISSTGNLIITGTIQGSSTVGEAVTVTLESPILIVTQGFLQPDSIKMIVATNSFEDSGIDINAYPNPTMNKVILNFKMTHTIDIRTEIFNSAGQLMNVPSIASMHNNSKQELNFKDFTAGIYYIVVKSKDRKLNRSFTVQKIN